MYETELIQHIMREIEPLLLEADRQLMGSTYDTDIAFHDGQLEAYKNVMDILKKELAAH